MPIEHGTSRIRRRSQPGQEESGWNDVEHLQGLMSKLREQISIRLLKTDFRVDSGRSIPTLPNGYDSLQHYRRSLMFVTKGSPKYLSSIIIKKEDEAKLPWSSDITESFQQAVELKLVQVKRNQIM
ncbi:11035_t:CDS:2 [Paraglomus occultum]|uniref:11035_t:CDS:1 n=1 Tax=Paraglomus occultum TaxID=144539 RepID=A0A9N9BZ74_9GLOM|nr:11035_t:CDS:2 [Paraglomus occultum]